MSLLPEKIAVAENEMEIKGIRAQGAGGQNVNKVSSAIHLRFNINNSSLPDVYKERLLGLEDQRITRDGVIIIKAQQYRSQEKNKEEAVRRLYEIINTVAKPSKERRQTKPTHGSQQRRLDSKVQRGQVKVTRGKVID